MSFYRTNATVAGLLMVVGSPVWANVTAAQVLDQLQGQLDPYLLADADKTERDRNMGRERTVTFAQEPLPDGGLLLRDVSAVFGDDNEGYTANLGTISLADQADGTVRMTFADNATVQLGDGSRLTTLNIRQSGLEIVVSGTPEAMNYQLSSDRINFDLADNKYPFFGTVNVVGFYAGLTPSAVRPPVAPGYLQNTPNDQKADLVGHVDYAYQLGFHALNVAGDFRRNPMEDNGLGRGIGRAGYAKGSLDADEIAISGTVTLPDILFTAHGRHLVTTDPGELLHLGLAATVDYTAHSVAYDYESIATDGIVGRNIGIGSFQSIETEFSASIDRKRLALRSGARLLVNAFADPDQPRLQGAFSNEWIINDTDVQLELPIGVTQGPADFAVTVVIGEVQADQGTWDVIDPDRIWPRDIGHFVADFGGSATLFIDLFQPWQAGRLRGGQNALEIHDISTEKGIAGHSAVAFELGGMFVTALFDMTFDHSDYDSFRNFPRPEGKVWVGLGNFEALVARMEKAEMFRGLDLPAIQAWMAPFLRPFDNGLQQFSFAIGPDGQIVPSDWPNNK